MWLNHSHALGQFSSYLGDSPPWEQFVGEVRGLVLLGVWRVGVRPVVLLGDPWNTMMKSKCGNPAVWCNMMLWSPFKGWSGGSLWFRNVANVEVPLTWILNTDMQGATTSLWENDPTSHLIYYPSKLVPNDFMVSISGFRSFSIQHDVHFVFIMVPFRVK